MIVYLKEKPTQTELERIFKSIGKGGKGFNTRKYAGKVKAKKDPVQIQRKLRDEWKRWVN
jgi:hypothetical protein